MLHNRFENFSREYKVLMADKESGDANEMSCESSSNPDRTAWTKDSRMRLPNSFLSSTISPIFSLNSNFGEYPF